MERRVVLVEQVEAAVSVDRELDVGLLVLSTAHEAEVVQRHTQRLVVGRERIASEETHDHLLAAFQQGDRLDAGHAEHLTEKGDRKAQGKAAQADAERMLIDKDRCLEQQSFGSRWYILLLAVLQHLTVSRQTLQVVVEDDRDAKCDQAGDRDTGRVNVVLQLVDKVVLIEVQGSSGLRLIGGVAESIRTRWIARLSGEQVGCRHFEADRSRWFTGL